MPNDSDGHLVQRTLRGETEAYGMLVQQHQQSIFNVCYRLLGEHGQAEDLAQDTFIRAYKRLDTFDVDRPFGPWIRRIATNLCLNQLERNQAIRQALLELPAHYQAVIELRHYQDMNYQEIADTLKLPVNTAKSHLFRARKLLAKKLEHFYENA